MKLNVLDRVIGIQALAEHTKFNFATYKTLDALKSKLLINEEEVKRYNFRMEGNDYKWDPLGTTEYIDFDFSELELKLLSTGLLAIEKREELTENHIPLFKKVCPDVS